MKIWTWRSISLLVDIVTPTNLETFDTWYKSNIQKIEEVAAAIGCKNVDDLKAQERELMDHRQRMAKTPSEWFEIANSPEYEHGIREIVKKFRREKRCHRNFFGSNAGIRCYC